MTSRKKAIESNSFNIGIFTGKSANYNLALLEALSQNSFTTWELAEILQKMINPVENKEIRFYRTQKIYSVIQRKSGRLDDLKSKGYIEEENGKWSLTKKGLIALSIKNPELIIGAIREHKNDVIERFKEKFVAFPNKIIDPLGVQIDIAEARPKLAKIDPSKMLVLMFEEARALISRGIDLDKISEDDLIDLTMARRSFREKVRKLVSGE